MTDNRRRGSNGGSARALKLSPEERSAIAKQAAAKRWAKPKVDPNPLIDPEVTKVIDHIAEGIKKSLDGILQENGLLSDGEVLQGDIYPTYGGIDRSMTMLPPNINPPAVPFQAIPVTTPPAILDLTHTETRCPACLAGQSLEKGEGTHVIGTSEHPIHPNPTPSEPPPIFIPPPTIQSPPEKPQKAPKRQAKPMPKEFKSASSYAEKRLPVAIKEKSEAMGIVAMRDAEINDLIRVIRALGGNVDPQAAQPQNYPNPAYNPNAGAPYMPQFPQPEPSDAMQNMPGIDPALYQANSGPVPRVNLGMPPAEMIPGTSFGGTEELPWVTR